MSSNETEADVRSATETQPKYRTEQPEDVEETLRSAANYCERTRGGEVVAAELREAAEYVNEEML